LIDNNISKPVPIESAKKPPAPPVFAAIGMAVSYYSYPLISAGQIFLLLPLFLLLIAVCFLRVIRYFPGPEPDGVYKAGIIVTAAAVGFSLGIAARGSFRSGIDLGVQATRVTAISGTLLEDPRTLRGGSGLGVLKLDSVTARGGLRATAAGSITVFFPSATIPRLKEFGRGCEIYADGIYADGIYSEGGWGPTFRATSVHIVTPAPPLEQFRTSLRMKLLDKFQNREGDSEIVWGDLASALLLGVRDDLDVDLSEGFRNSGCSHILALSGMHLAILSGVLVFLVRRPLGIRWASLLGAIFIVFYVFVAGSQPSLVRAAIMYLIGAFALWGFLRTNALSLLGMAFIVQLVFQGQTGLSISFILSYLALFGILTLGEKIRALFRGRLPDALSGVLSASLGAFIVTSPVVALYFDSLRPIGILAGLILAPISALFMVLSLAALAASFLPLPLWDLLDFVLTWVYRFLEYIVSLAGQAPGLSVSGPAPVLIVTVVLWVLVLFVQRRDEAYRNSVASFE
jgi:competence protein ComEC